MSEQTTVLSVRGDARVEVPPDLATLWCEISVHERHRDAALRSAASALEAVLADLRELDGVPLTPGERPPLGWLAKSVRTYEETRFDRHREEEVRTGRIFARVALHIEVRDFGLLQDLGETLASHEALNQSGVQWSVDDDNPAWPQVRAAAIKAALQKGRDYAAALGGTAERVEHVADAGLLGTDQASGEVHVRAQRLSAASMGSAPSLDPEPQELRAVIEARLIASLPALT